MRDARPTVSVILPTRGRAELLRRAVSSVMNQSYDGPIECLIVSDQSERPDLPFPSTPGRAIRFLANDRTPGAAGSRNTGIIAASGGMLAFCDDDDEWLPTKLERQVEEHSRHPDCRLLACGARVETPRGSIRRVPTTSSIGFPQLLQSRHMELVPSTLMAERSFLLEIGLLDEKIPGSYGEDYDWLLRATAQTDVLVVREPLTVIHWDRESWFAGRWELVAEALEYLLAKHSALRGCRRGFARIAGQIAIARACSGDRRNARAWALRSIQAWPLQPRPYAALIASTGIPLGWAVGVARALGRGV
jgi:glycosyltransferase involved in cell wall biosynthesis